MAPRNITKALIDQYQLTLPEVAVRTGAHFNSVRNWYQGKALSPYYRKELEELLTVVTKEKSNNHEEL